MSEHESILQIIDEQVITDFDNESFYCPEEALSVPELIDHIVNFHHAYMRRKFPQLIEVSRHMLLKYNDEKLSQLLFYLDQLTSEQLCHIDKEEETVFPYIRSLFGVGEAIIPSFGSIKSPLSIIEMEHETADQELSLLRSLTNDFTPPAWAGNDLIEFYKDLQILEKDLKLHLYKENNLLHPKAVAKESSFYK